MNDTNASSGQADMAPSSVSSNAARSGSTSWAMVISLMAIGALAGGVGSQVVHATRDLFQIAPERLGMPPHPPAIEREMTRNAISNHALGFGSLGFAICGALGLAVGVLSRSAAAAIQGLVAGAVAGAILGAGGGIAAWGLYEALAFVPLDGLFKAMLIHFPNWLLLASGVILAAAVGLRRRPAMRQLLLSAVAAAAIAAVLFPILGLAVFPAEASDRPIPFDMGLRLLCFASGGAVLGFAAARWCKQS
jgi:hypothetical protein